MEIYFKDYDGLMFCILSGMRNHSKLEKSTIFSDWNCYDHSYPSINQINESLSRFVESGFILINDKRIIFTQKYYTFEKEHRKFAEKHIDMQLRYRKIFEQMKYDGEGIITSFLE